MWKSGLILWVCFLGFSKPIENRRGQQSITLRIINACPYTVYNVTLFSEQFANLKPGDTSNYQTLNYRPLQDDSLIYLSIEEKNYGRYVTIPKADNEKVSYVIDSIQDGILYVSHNYE